jgi:hypothetical protein
VDSVKQVRLQQEMLKKLIGESVETAIGQEAAHV